MHIEVHGPEHMLEEIRLHLQDQLERAGYREGPKISAMEAGILIDYVKEDSIISIQVTEESEIGESLLHVECEKELPELRDFWDAALVGYGKAVLERLMNFAVDKARVGGQLK